MPTISLGLKYRPVFQKIETEQQLLRVFADLRGHYQRFNQTFKLFTSVGEPVKSCQDFLKIAVQEEQYVVLVGSGNIFGTIVENADFELDLSRVSQLTKYWDISRDGSCHSCLKQVRDHTNSSWECATKRSYGRKNCPDYDAHLKNHEGKAAREDGPEGAEERGRRKEDRGLEEGGRGEACRKA